MNSKNDKKNKPLFSRILRCGSKTYNFEIHETSSGSWLLRILEMSQSGKRKGEYDIIVYAEYLPQFLDTMDAVRRHIESESSGTMTA